MAQIRSPTDVDRSELAPGVSAGQLGHGDALHAQHVQIAPDGAVPEHSHPHEQISFVTAGSIEMTIDGESAILEEGDTVVIPGEVTHGATTANDEPASLIDVFSPPREDLLS